MPVYNASRFIMQAVESVLSQSFKDFEFIIIEDGSTDNSLLLLAEFAAKDSRIILRSRRNTGYTVALNEGLALAQGRYIARMDNDDICREARFERQWTYLERNPQCVAVGCFIERMDMDGWPISVLRRPTEHDAIDRLHFEGAGGAIIHPAAMLRADALRQVGGYRPQWEPADDTDLFLRLAEVGRLANLPEVLLNYRFNLGGMCCTRTEIQSEKLAGVVAEARLRRGLEGNFELKKGRAFSRLRYEASIVYHSFLSAHFCTTGKHLALFIIFLFRSS
jgi:glycosyltransferase involved in cell wall biosynthesis